jgi:hypothetical protein
MLEWLLTFAIFALSIVVSGVAMRTRALANAIWRLTSP